MICYIGWGWCSWLIYRGIKILLWVELNFSFFKYLIDYRTCFVRYLSRRLNNLLAYIILFYRCYRLILLLWSGNQVLIFEGDTLFLLLLLRFFIEYGFYNVLSLLWHWFKSFCFGKRNFESFLVLYHNFVNLIISLVKYNPICCFRLFRWLNDCFLNWLKFYILLIHFCLSFRRRLRFGLI